MTKQDIKTKYGKYGDLVYEFYKRWRDCRYGYLVIEENQKTKELSVGWYYNQHEWTPGYSIISKLPFGWSNYYKGQELWKKLKTKANRCEYIYRCMINDEFPIEVELELIKGIKY